MKGGQREMQVGVGKARVGKVVGIWVQGAANPEYRREAVWGVRDTGQTAVWKQGGPRQVADVEFLRRG